MIKSKGGNYLSEAYEIAIHTKNTLIQIGRLEPKPTMPLFRNIQTHALFFSLCNI